MNALLVSTTRDKNGGRAKVKFQLTAKVTRALEWPDMPEGTAEWCPDVDELKSSLVELTPNNEELKSKAVAIDASTIGDFIVVRKHKKVGKNSVKADKVITEVICTVRFADPTGCAKLEQYIQGAARSEMLVCYTPQPVQGELEGTRVDMSPEDPQIPLLATAEQIEAVKDLPDGDPNVEYVERAKKRMADKKRGAAAPKPVPEEEPTVQ